jgi:predicted tellurium resistance membrane protein TerC
VLELLAQPETYLALATLTAMEIVLGLDNVIFIAILVGKLPPAQQAPARRLGLSLALALRIALLFAITWVMGWTSPLFAVLGKSFSGRDLVLLGGGLFLVAKATHEIHDKLETSGAASHARSRPGPRSLGPLLAQIVALDLVYSLDSNITAVGMAQDLWVMVVAMIAAVGVMFVLAERIGAFVDRHPSMKVLALSFLLLIGVMLVADAMGQHIGKGYIYFAMAFALCVELVNLRVRPGAKAEVERR